MPECARCEAFITAEAVRVLYPEGVDPQALPGCPECSVFKGGEFVPKKHGRDSAGRQRNNAHEVGDAPDAPQFEPRERGVDG